MQKRIKIILYTILILVIIVVVRLMLGTRNLKKDIPTNTQTETSTGQETANGDNIGDTTDLGIQNNTFEEDVMKDLEGFFNNNNGYEDIQGEYGFNNPENE